MKLFFVLTFDFKAIAKENKTNFQMDSDEEYFDYEVETWDDLDSSSVSVSNTPSFETLTAEDIVKLMNQYIEHVNAIVQVRATQRNKCCIFLKWNFPLK